MVEHDESHQIILENNMKRIANTAAMLSMMGYAVMTSPFAQADESFWYGGVNVGQSRANIDDDRIQQQLLDSGLTTTSISDEDKDFAYKVFGGYQFNDNFALEAGYFDLGEFGYKAVTNPEGTLTGTIELKGINLDLLGFLPLNEKFSVFARVGANYAQAKDTYSSTGAVDIPADASPSKNATNYKAGVGVQYDLSRSLALRAEAERYRINDAVGNDGDINMFSLGLVYRFDRKSPAPVRKAAAPAATAPLPVIVPVKMKTQEYCTILDIQFEIKQDAIELKEKEKLAVIGRYMSKYPDTTAVIEGHSDNVGTSEYNQKLSLRRAESVVSYLVDEFHIAPNRLDAVGYGESRPIADNSIPEGKRANRRIAAVIGCARDIADLKVAPARMTMAMEVEFDAREAEILPQYHDGLAEVVRFMKANPSVSATVEGHAAKRAGMVSVSQEQAMNISQRRAQAVVNYLVSAGISRSRLTTSVFGSTRRISYGTTLEGQQENRRVNIIFDYSK